MTLDLSKYQSDFREKRDIINALAWSSTRSYLQEANLENVYKTITSVSIDEGVLTIRTGKSIANSELKIHREALMKRVNTSLKIWKESVKEIRLK